MQEKLKCKFNKNDITKSIIWLLTILVLFILINLAIWAFKYGWISRYATLLDNKDWSDSVSQMSITNPVAIFYDETWSLDKKENQDLEENMAEENQNADPDIQQETQENIDIKEEVEENPAIDPYDPEFEDEFNSFFGWENSELNNIEDQELYNNLSDDAVDSNEVSDSHNASTGQPVQEQKNSIIKRLIERFNE